MSRADELMREASDSSQPTMQFWRGIAEKAMYAVESLESTLAEREQRIAEMESALRVALEDATLARAEVPEWCWYFLTEAARWYMSGEPNGPDDIRLGKALANIADQLRACGIEVT